jgi:hypothetical protein
MFQWGSFLRINKERHERSLAKSGTTTGTGTGITKTTGATAATGARSCTADLSSDARDPCIQEVLKHIDTIHLHLNPIPIANERRRCSKPSDDGNKLPHKLKR